MYLSIPNKKKKITNKLQSRTTKTDLVKLVKRKTLSQGRVQMFERLSISRTIRLSPHLVSFVPLSDEQVSFAECDQLVWYLAHYHSQKSWSRVVARCSFGLERGRLGRGRGGGVFIVFKALKLVVRTSHWGERKNPTTGAVILKIKNKMRSDLILTCLNPIMRWWRQVFMTSEILVSSHNGSMCLFSPSKYLYLSLASLAVSVIMISTDLHFLRYLLLFAMSVVITALLSFVFSCSMMEVRRRFLLFQRCISTIGPVQLSNMWLRLQLNDTSVKRRWYF